MLRVRHSCSVSMLFISPIQNSLSTLRLYTCTKQPITYRTSNKHLDSLGVLHRLRVIQALKAQYRLQNVQFLQKTLINGFSSYLD